MTTQAGSALPEATAPDAPLMSTWFRSLRASITTWVATCADHYAAAAAYEDMSRLSNAELARRGLHRGDLGRFACDIANRR